MTIEELQKENEHLKEEVKELKQAVKWSWMAGLFDGEGSFNLRRRRDNNYGIKAQIAMTHNKTIQAVNDLCNGNIYKYNKSYLNSNCKDQLYWSLNNNSEVVAFASKILPYSVTKEDQARLIIEFGEVWHKRNRYDEPLTFDEATKLNMIHYDMQQLNRKGPNPILEGTINGN